MNLLLTILKIFNFVCRCREKQRKEASRLQAVNRKLTAMNKLLMEENDRLQKQVSQLVYENSFFRQQSQNVNLLSAYLISCGFSPILGSFLHFRW